VKRVAAVAETDGGSDEQRDQREIDKVHERISLG